MKTEIIDRSHGSGYLQMKVFKILNPKNKGTSADSDSARGLTANSVNKNIKALIEEAYKKIDEITAEDLLKRIQQMK